MINNRPNPLSSQQDWDSYKGLGIALLNINQFEEAVNAFQQSLALQQDWESYKALGRALLKNNQFKEAVNAFQQSLALQQDWDSYKGLGIALLNTNQFEEAVNAFQQSLAIKENWDSYKGLGITFFKTNQFEEAINAFKQSLALQQGWETYKSLGIALLMTNQFEEAINALQQSLALQQDWDSYKSLGIALFNTNQFEEAVIALQKSLAIKEDWESYKGLGRALFNTNHFEEAVIAFQKSLAIKEDWETYEALERTLFKTNQYLYAANAIKSSIRINLQMSDSEHWPASPELKSILSESMRRLSACIQLTFKNDSDLLKGLVDLPKETLLANTNSSLNIRTTLFLQRLGEIISEDYINPFIFTHLSMQAMISLKESDFNSKKIQKHLCSAYNIDAQELIDSTCESKDLDSILSIGDSHTEIFNGLNRIKLIIISGATAYSISNPDSATGSYKRINKALSVTQPKKTGVILTFGEIDLRMHIHKQSRLQGRIPELIVHDTVSNYMSFVDTLLQRGFKVYVNGPHSGGGYREDYDGLYQNSTPLEERNDACFYMNELLRSECSARNICYASLCDIVIDSLTRKNRNSFFYDHHLHPPPTTIGEGLKSIIISRLFNQPGAIAHRTSNGKDLNIVCRVLASNIAGAQNLQDIKTNSHINTKKLIENNNEHYMLIELPFPILVHKLNLEFKTYSICNKISSYSRIIYECCDPSQKITKNIFNGNASYIHSESGENVNVIHDFSHLKFNHMHSRFIFLSISNADQSCLSRLSISRMRYVGT